MSEAKHTPGPWWVTDSGVRDRRGYICHTLPAQRYTGQDERFERETAERAANKSLIAAAPELLEALRTVLAEWNALYPSFPTSTAIEDAEFSGFQLARAAIAKATQP